MGFGVCSLVFIVWGLVFVVWCLLFGVYCLGFVNRSARELGKTVAKINDFGFVIITFVVCWCASRVCGLVFGCLWFVVLLRGY